jgi:hypothetical protein
MAGLRLNGLTQGEGPYAYIWQVALVAALTGLLAPSDQRERAMRGFRNSRLCKRDVYWRWRSQVGRCV